MTTRTPASQCANVDPGEEARQLSIPIRLSGNSYKAILLALKFVTAKGNWPHPNATARFRSLPARKKAKNKPPNTRRQRLQHFAPHPRALDPGFPKADTAQMKVLGDLRGKLESRATGRGSLRLTWLEISGLLFGLAAAKQLAKAKRIAMPFKAVRAATSAPVRKELENSRRRAKRLFLNHYGAQRYKEEETRWNNHLRWIHAYVLWANCNRLAFMPAIYSRRVRGATASFELVRAELVRRSVNLPPDSKLRSLVKQARRLRGWPAAAYSYDYNRAPRLDHEGNIRIPEIPSPEQLASELADTVIEIMERERNKRRPHAEGLLDDRGNPIGKFKEALELVKAAPSLEKRRRAEIELLRDYKISKRTLGDLTGVSEGTIRHDLKVATAQEKASSKANKNSLSKAKNLCIVQSERADLIRRVMSPDPEWEDEEDPYPFDIEENSSPVSAAPEAPKTAPSSPAGLIEKAGDTEFTDDAVNKLGRESLAWLKAQAPEYPGVIVGIAQRLAKHQFSFRKKKAVLSLREAIEQSRPRDSKPGHWDWLAGWLMRWITKAIEMMSPDTAIAQRIARSVINAY